jgi:hypothetical protein
MKKKAKKQEAADDLCSDYDFFALKTVYVANSPSMPRCGL